MMDPVEKLENRKMVLEPKLNGIPNPNETKSLDKNRAKPESTETERESNDITEPTKTKLLNENKPIEENYNATKIVESAKVVPSEEANLQTDTAIQQAQANPNQMTIQAPTWALPRPGKKLLVLDIDLTLCNLSAELSKDVTLEEKRPYLDHFLATVYEHFDMVVWSATPKFAILDKIKKLPLVSDKYNLLFYLDFDNMYKVKIGSRVVHVKPLEMVWRRVSNYNRTNTIMVDDRAVNFILNPNNGIPIKPYLKENYQSDRELLILSRYLINLATSCADFSTINHKKWQVYKPYG